MMAFFYFFDTLVSKNTWITSLRLHNMQHMQHSYTTWRTILCDLVSVLLYFLLWRQDKIHRSSAHTLNEMALKSVFVSAENIVSHNLHCIVHFTDEDYSSYCFLQQIQTIRLQA